jgi:hypothetical protein
MPDSRPESQSTPGPSRDSSQGLEIPAFFARDGRHPFDSLEWERRDAIIEDEGGRVIFAQKSAWSSST